jgi:hypothetical protein
MTILDCVLCARYYSLLNLMFDQRGTGEWVR